MLYLRLKNTKSGKLRKNGTREVIPLLMEKSKKYGKVTSETALSRKKSLLFVGAGNAGKSQCAHKLFDYALDIWGGQPKITAKLFLGGIAPIGAWQEQQEVIAWHDKTQTKGKSPAPPWKKLKSHEKDEALVNYCLRHRSIVVIDDAHKLTGRKADLAKRCLIASKRAVLTASEENRLPPAIRTEILRKEPQIISLSTDTAYDLTGAVVWVFIAGAVAMGAYEMAIILAGLKWLGRGRTAARQD